jgi:hypothetical protein
VQLVTYWTGKFASTFWYLCAVGSLKLVRSYHVSGLRSLEVAFPPHDSSDAGSNPAEGGTLSCLTRVVNLLHVKEPQVPRRPLSKIIGHFPSKSFGRGLAMS